MAFWDKFRKKKKVQTGEKEPVRLEEVSSEQEGGSEAGSDGGTQDESRESFEKKMSAENMTQQEEVNPVYKEDKKRFVRECCELIQENEKQIQLTKKEYEGVTEYLTDIQKIDRLEGKERQRLLDDCKKIQTLIQERNQYKNRNLTITEAQIRRFDRYEEDLVPEIKKMYEAQSYQKAIESDIGHLEKEKKNLNAERKEIIERQSSLKSMAKVLFALILSLILLFGALYLALKKDMTLPYLATLLLAAVSATVIFVEANKNRRDMILAERKMTKAISLLNRVKIKYVNNTAMMEYDREKYGVKDAADFEQLWTQYCRAKEYERRFRENTDQLNACNEDMLSLLREAQVKEPEIWLSQTVAILDKREMVEIRHELNQRRQKLRERIQYNTQLKEAQLVQIDKILNENPSLRGELLEIVRNGIKLSLKSS